MADRVKIDGRPSIGSLNRHRLHTRQNATGRATDPQYHYTVSRYTILCIRMLVHLVIRITTEQLRVRESFLSTLAISTLPTLQFLRIKITEPRVNSEPRFTALANIYFSKQDGLYVIQSLSNDCTLMYRRLRLTFFYFSLV